MFMRGMGFALDDYAGSCLFCIIVRAIKQQFGNVTLAFNMLHIFLPVKTETLLQFKMGLCFRQTSKNTLPPG